MFRIIILGIITTKKKKKTDEIPFGENRMCSKIKKRVNYNMRLDMRFSAGNHV